MSEHLAYRAVVSADGDIDRHAASLEWVRFQRRDGCLYVECRTEDAASAAGILARAGLRLERADLPPRAASLRPAIVSHLVAFADSDVHDVVVIRGTSVGEAISSLAPARRWPFQGRREERRDRTRALFRGQDVAFAWRRTLFAPPSLLRSRRLAGVRPVVFDRSALEAGGERVGFALDGALGAWVRG